MNFTGLKKEGGPRIESAGIKKKKETTEKLTRGHVQVTSRNAHERLEGLAPEEQGAKQPEPHGHQSFQQQR